MNCGTDLLKFLCAWVLEHCSEDLMFVSKRLDSTILDRLQSIAVGSFEKISYAEAINNLKKVISIRELSLKCYRHATEYSD